MTRRISDDSLIMSEKDEDGFHKVVDRYCEGKEFCFRFDGCGRNFESCVHYRLGPRGEKICTR